MRRLLLAAAALSSAACFAPRPCTQALCPSKLEGSYRVTGWNRVVSSGSGAPSIPIVSDSSVDVTDGTVEFTNGKSVIKASAGSSFRFEVSTASAHAASLFVTAGSVTVALSSAAVAAPVPTGVPYLLPAAN
jgi:hypothetical protein